MRYEKIDFNVNWILSLSEEEFIKDENLKSLWSGVHHKTRLKRFHEVYKLAEADAHNRKLITSSVKS